MHNSCLWLLATTVCWPFLVFGFWCCFVVFALDIDALIVINERYISEPLNYAYLSYFNLSLIAFVACFLCAPSVCLSSCPTIFIDWVTYANIKWCWHLGIVFPIADDSLKLIHRSLSCVCNIMTNANQLLISNIRCLELGNANLQKYSWFRD